MKSGVITYPSTNVLTLIFIAYESDDIHLLPDKGMNYQLRLGLICLCTGNTGS